MNGNKPNVFQLWQFLLAMTLILMIIARPVLGIYSGTPFLDYVEAFPVSFVGALIGTAVAWRTQANKMERLGAYFPAVLSGLGWIALLAFGQSRA